MTRPNFHIHRVLREILDTYERDRDITALVSKLRGHLSGNLCRRCSVELDLNTNWSQACADRHDRMCTTCLTNKARDYYAAKVGRPVRARRSKPHGGAPLPCRFCNATLTEGENWPPGAARRKSYVCKHCRRTTDKARLAAKSSAETAPLADQDK